MIRLDNGESGELVQPLTTQILSFIGAATAATSTPTYSSVTVVTQSTSLQTAIGALDARANNHTHSGASGQGPLINLGTSVTGALGVGNGGTGTTTSTGSGSVVLNTNPLLVSPDISGTVSGGASYTAPTLVGAIATNNFSLHSLSDLAVYSDAGSTLKFSIDGATGNFGVNSNGFLNFTSAALNPSNACGISETNPGELVIQAKGTAMLCIDGNVTSGVVRGVRPPTGLGGGIRLGDATSPFRSITLSGDGDGISVTTGSNIVSGGHILPSTDNSKLLGQSVTFGAATDLRWSRVHAIRLHQYEYHNITTVTGGADENHWRWNSNSNNGLELFALDDAFATGGNSSAIRFDRTLNVVDAVCIPAAASFGIGLGSGSPAGTIHASAASCSVVLEDNNATATEQVWSIESNNSFSINTLTDGYAAGDPAIIITRNGTAIDTVQFLTSNSTGGTVLQTNQVVIVQEDGNADSLITLHTARTTTTDATPTVIFSHTMAQDSSAILEASVVGQRDDATSTCGSHKEITVARDGAGSAAMIGGSETSIHVKSGAGTMALGVSGSDITVTVTGVAAQNWSWKAFIRVCEIS